MKRSLVTLTLSLLLLATFAGGVAYWFEDQRPVLLQYMGTALLLIMALMCAALLLVALGRALQWLLGKINQR